MNRKSMRSLISYLITLTFVTAPGVPVTVYAESGSKECSESDSANDLKEKASAIANDPALGAAVLSTPVGTGAKDAGMGIQGGAAQCSAGLTHAKGKLEKCLSACQKKKDKPEELKICQGPIQRLISAAESGIADKCPGYGGGGGEVSDATDSGGGSSSGGGGGMGGMGDMLMGAALGAGLMYLMNKKKEDEEKDKKDEKLDCKSDGAAQYEECTNTLVADCVGDTTSARCTNFYNIYCSSKGTERSSSRGSAAESASGTQAATAKTPATPGEGVGSPFCQNQMAAAFCKTSGRTTCPSCLQLATANSPTCKANPMACLAQNSNDQLEAARQSCPTDPIFSNPSYAANAAPSGQQSATGSGSSSSQLRSPITATGSSASGGGMSSAQTASVQSGAGMSSGGVSDVGSGAGASGIAGGASASANSYSTSSTRGSTSSSSGLPSDTASGVPRTTASASGGPRSDVGGPYGASLFSANSSVFKGRCAQRRLAGCVH